MATTHGTLQERLLDAWMSNGHLALPMAPGQAGKPMSDALAQRLIDFNVRMSCVPAKANEGTFASTILGLSDEEASDAAKEIMDIDFDIRMELDQP